MNVDEVNSKGTNIQKLINIQVGRKAVLPCCVEEEEELVTCFLIDMDFHCSQEI
jgi:hypothetical protein